MSTITEKANSLHISARTQKPRGQFSNSEQYTLAEAYDVQHELIQRRIKEGFPLIGVKMGFTSKAKMIQMGVDDMIIGQLTADMTIHKDEAFKKKLFIHPRAEPEIAFRLSKDINGPLTVDHLHHYIDGVAAAIEVIDSRYDNFKFSLEDVVADNCSSSAYAVGDWCEVPLGLNGLDMTMTFDGAITAQGNSDAILDNPFEALSAATRLASEYGIPLKTGMVVLAGASTAAHFIKDSSSVTLDVDGLGVVSFNVV